MGIFPRRKPRGIIVPRTAYKYIIGIDAALRNVGYVVFDNMDNKLLSGNISTPSGMLDHTAIDEIITELFNLLNPYLGDPRAVAMFIEEISFSRAGDKTHARSELCGVIKYLFRQEKINIYSVNNSAANSFLGMLTNSKPSSRKSPDIKAWTKAMVHRHFGFYTENDNIADAYVIGRFGYAYLVSGKRLDVRAACKVR